jgi:hypothetical protein
MSLKSIAGCPFFDKDNVVRVGGVLEEFVGDARLFGLGGSQHSGSQLKVSRKRFGFDVRVGDEDDHELDVTRLWGVASGRISAMLGGWPCCLLYQTFRCEADMPPD